MHFWAFLYIGVLNFYHILKGVTNPKKLRIVTLKHPFLKPIKTLIFYPSKVLLMHPHKLLMQLLNFLFFNLFLKKLFISRFYLPIGFWTDKILLILSGLMNLQNKYERKYKFLSLDSDKHIFQRHKHINSSSALRINRIKCCM